MELTSGLPHARLNLDVADGGDAHPDHPAEHDHHAHQTARPADLARRDKVGT